MNNCYIQTKDRYSNDLKSKPNKQIWQRPKNKLGKNNLAKRNTLFSIRNQKNLMLYANFNKSRLERTRIQMYQLNSKKKR